MTRQVIGITSLRQADIADITRNMDSIKKKTFNPIFPLLATPPHPYRETMPAFPTEMQIYPTMTLLGTVL